MNKDLIAIFEYLEREKGIKREIVIEAIRESLELAAKKSVHGAENVTVSIHSKTGEIEVFCDKIVVNKVTNAATQISIKEVAQYVSGCELGQIVTVPATPKDFGRIAAQKARQVILQKLKGAERDVIYEEYRHRVGTLISGGVKRIGRGDCVIVDLGKVEGVMPRRYYLPQETFHIGDKVLALLEEVRDTDIGGAEVILSRSHPKFVQQLLIQEVPEVSDGTVTVERIVREPGYRTKMIVRSQDPKVDPVGACIGIRGARVKNIVRELGTEKIDIIPFHEDPEIQLKNALNPVVYRKLFVSEEGDKISLVVDDEDFPTAIGKKGQNVRLLSDLLDVEVVIQKMSDYLKVHALERAQLATVDDPSLDMPLTSIEGIPGMITDQLSQDERFKTKRQLLMATPEEVVEATGMSLELARKILENLHKTRT